jgi:cytochrome c
LTGTALYSYYLEFIKRDDASTNYAKILLGYPLKKISIPIVLGIVPFSVIFSVDKIWLVGDEFNPIHNWMLVDFVLFVISAYLLYTYNSTFELINVLSRSVVDKDSDDFVDLMQKNLNRHKRSALYGALSILVTLFLFSLLSVAKLDYVKGEFRFDIFAYAFSLNVLLRFIFYLIISFSLVFIVSLFFNFGWKETETEHSEGFKEFIQTKSLKGALASILVQPLFLLIELLILPKNGLSYLVFLSSGLAVLLIFIILNQLNAYSKEVLNSYLKFSFYLFVVVLISVSTRDVVATGNVLKPKFVEISEKFLTYEEGLKNKLNIKTVSISGEEIFIAKCSACHQFDSKLVGPPYNVVLKKYENNKDNLVKFILNPVKVDPAYPPMPSQGLIPPEAEAVADYILKVYKENVK